MESLIFNIQSKVVFLDKESYFISGSLIIYIRHHTQEDISCRSNTQTTDTSIRKTCCEILCKTF